MAFQDSDFCLTGDLGFSSPNHNKQQKNIERTLSFSNDQLLEKETWTPSCPKLKLQRNSSENDNNLSHSLHRRNSDGDIIRKLSTTKIEPKEVGLSRFDYTTFFKMFRKGFVNKEKTKTKDVSSQRVSMGQGHPSLELEESHKTISMLQGKLAICQELLVGKYRASEILLNLLFDSTQDNKEYQEKWTKEKAENQREINELQFQVQFTEGNLTDSQRSWLERFNSLIQENSELVKSFKEQQKENNSLTIQNSILRREREELLSLQEVSKKILHCESEVCTSLKDENLSPEQKTIELAILGACKCKFKKGLPCPCAQSSASKYRTIITLKSQLDLVQQEHGELSQLCQLYKNAFEEQLSRNKALTRRNLLEVYDHDPASKVKGMLKLRGKDANPQEALQSLVELVCDRTDELQRQQCLTRILAQRVTELENEYSGTT